MASLVDGWPGPTDARLARLAASATLAVHASTFAHLRASGRRVEAVAEALGLPDWVGAQVEKNRRKALVYETLGPALVVLAAWFVGDRWWHRVVAGASLAFQVGAFVGEFAIIAAQARLVRDVKPWATSTGPAGDP